MEYRLAIIGGGTMGHASVRGAIDTGCLRAEEIVVVEIDGGRRARLKDLGCAVTSRVDDAVLADQIMLAVKPQVFPEVTGQIAPLPRSVVVISIMAGLSSATIRTALGPNARVVRVMPNTPCQVREGITAIALGAGAQSGDDLLARLLFSALGRTTDVDEAHMYAVTAVSGSGPAYVFLLAEAMQAAAERVGLDADTARRLVHQTIRGAGHLLTSGENVDAAALREAVTTPKGTTEAAMRVLLARELPGIVIEAIAAARDRGIELDEGR